MALEDILRKIKGDAAAEAERILAEARGERERMLAAGKAKAQAAADRIRASGQALAQDTRRRELATASVEVRRVVLSAKQQVLGEVFERALTDLANLPDAEYRGLLADLAIRAAGTGREQVIVSARDRARLDNAWLADVNARLAARGLEPALTFAPASRALRGGLILQAGDVEINCTFERTLAALREQLEPEVAAMLFSGLETSEARQ
jgi:V/A-type H+-transporting ATPase subunit E